MIYIKSEIIKVYGLREGILELLRDKKREIEEIKISGQDGILYNMVK
jgi:hypothetical protein